MAFYQIILYLVFRKLEQKYGTKPSHHDDTDFASLGK